VEIRESDLPGIGRKYQMETRKGDKLVVIIHDDGSQEIYHFDKDQPDEGISMVTLADDEARQIAGIIGGMSYRPKALEAIEAPLEELVIEWYRIEPGSKSIGKTLGELALRPKAGANVIAVIEADRQKTIGPGSDYPLTANSILIVVCERRHIKTIKEILLNGE
jgi:TrkA domain protein